jgi:hypothetical protein
MALAVTNTRPEYYTVEVRAALNRGDKSASNAGRKSRELSRALSNCNIGPSASLCTAINSIIEALAFP